MTKPKWQVKGRYKENNKKEERQEITVKEREKKEI